jgi:transposase-like protein
MFIFKGQGLLAFIEAFKSDEDCLDYLANRKWNPENGGFKCSKCGHNKCTIRKKNLARDCNKCHYVESPTAGTMFHRVKFGLRNAFIIAYQMSTKTRGLSATQISVELGISRPTAWLFMHKVRESMHSRASSKMTGEVQVKAFAFGWKEDFRPNKSHNPKRKKIVGAIELNERGGVVHCRFQHVENYSSKALRPIFKNHIDANASIVAEKWVGFQPIVKEYNITRKSSSFQNFIQTNWLVHHMKTWLRSGYTWMHEHHMQRYLDEFSFRINRSNRKDKIFESLIERMISTKPLHYKDIKVRT